MCKTPYERQSIISKYIEPSSEERKNGKKQPTPAHKAIAKLVKQGFIKVIITTNFDRLLEMALENEGVVPTTISTEDSLSGAEPIDHASCYIIKVHGDYKDGRIKNTTQELKDYPLAYQEILKRIFSDYGLIVCGWSGEWDIALKEAMKMAVGRRYSTFWASYGNLSEGAKDLINHRKAEIVDIHKLQGADGFFDQLQRKLEQIEKFGQQRPRSVTLLVESLKDYLSEPEKNKIKIEELFKNELEYSLVKLAYLFNDILCNQNYYIMNQLYLNVLNDLREENINNLLNLSESNTEALAKMAVVLGRWGTNYHSQLIYEMIRILLIKGRINCCDEKINVIWRNSATLIYICYGLGLIKAEKWKELNLYFKQPLSLEGIEDSNSLPILKKNSDMDFYLSPKEISRRRMIAKELNEDIEEFEQIYLLVIKWVYELFPVEIDYEIIWQIFAFLNLLSIFEKTASERFINQIKYAGKTSDNKSLNDYFSENFDIKDILPYLKIKSLNPKKEKIISLFQNKSFIDDLVSSGFTSVKVPQIIEYFFKKCVFKNSLKN